MSLKSGGRQFLINIKPKYRTTVTPILEMLKENREASDFVCQAILEKFSREGGVSTIESEVQSLLEGKLVSLGRVEKQPSSKPNNLPPSSDAHKEISATSEEEIKMENTNRINTTNEEYVDPSVNEKQDNVNEDKPDPIENQGENDKSSFATPSVESQTPSEVKTTFKPKKSISVTEKESDLGSRLFLDD